MFLKFLAKKENINISEVFKRMKGTGRCKRAEVIAVISTDLHYIASINEPELNYCNEECKKFSSGCRAIHAEISVINSVNTELHVFNNAAIYINKTPCENCIRAIEKTKIKKVYIVNDTEHLECSTTLEVVYIKLKI